MKNQTVIKIQKVVASCEHEKNGMPTPEGCFMQAVLDCWELPCEKIANALTDMELHLIKCHNDGPNEYQVNKYLMELLDYNG